MDDGQCSINSINKKEHNPRHVPRGKHQPSQCKQDDKRDTNASHIPGKALRLALGPEVEDAKHRFPNLTLATFPDGGHMMKGHAKEIDKALDAFINKSK